MNWRCYGAPSGRNAPSRCFFGCSGREKSLALLLYWRRASDIISNSFSLLMTLQDWTRLKTLLMTFGFVVISQGVLSSRLKSTPPFYCDCSVYIIFSLSCSTLALVLCFPFPCSPRSHALVLLQCSRTSSVPSHFYCYRALIDVADIHI